MTRETEVFDELSGDPSSAMSEPSERIRLAEETDRIRRHSRVVRHQTENLAEQLAHIQREVQRTLDELHHEFARRGDS
jgi:hypothetical protein